MTWVHFVLIFLGIISIFCFIGFGKALDDDTSFAGGMLAIGVFVFLIFFAWTLNHTALVVNCDRDGGIVNVANQCVVEKSIKE